MSTDEDNIIAAVKENPDGIHSSQLRTLVKNGPVDVVVNKLLATSAVEMSKDSKSGGFYLRIPKGTKLAGAKPEEQVVFALIEEAGSKGIWIKDIRDKSGLKETALKKVLKELEKQKNIRSFTPVGTTRKSYMLYNLELDESVSGGVFYSNQEVDTSFVNELIKVSVTILKKRQEQAFQENPRKVDALKASCVHISEVAQYIRDRKICNVAFTEDDVGHILELAWKKNFIYKQNESGYYRYRPNHPGVDGTTFAICNFCPVRSECRIGYKISPETCVYFDAIKTVEIVPTTIGDLDYDSDF